MDSVLKYTRKFITANIFEDDLAKVQFENRKYGFINKNGQIHMGKLYDSGNFEGFKDNVARTQFGDRLQFMGKNLLPVFRSYKKLWVYMEGFSKVVRDDNTMTFIDSFGKEMDISMKDLNHFSEGYAVAQDFNNNYTYVDAYGKFHGKYIEARDFSDGVAIVVDGYNGTYNHFSGFNPTRKKYSIIDKNFNIIASIQDRGYDKIHDFHDGYARAVLDDEEGYVFIDKEGDVCSEVYKYAWDFKDGFACVIEEGSRYCYFIDKDFKQISKEYINSSEHFSEGFALVRLENGNVTYINTKGKEFNTQYRQGGPFSEGFARVQLDDGLWYYIDKSGKVCFGGFRENTSFHCGRAFVQVEFWDSWVCINEYGRFVIDFASLSKDQIDDILKENPEYKADISDVFISDNLAPINFALKCNRHDFFNDGYYFHYDYETSSCRVIDINGNTIKHLKSSGSSWDGCMEVKDDEGYYLIDKDLNQLSDKYYGISTWNGNEGWYVTYDEEDNYIIRFFNGEFIEEKFADVECFNEGYFNVQLVGSLKYTFIDKNGKHYFGEWDSITSFDNGVAVVEKDEKYSILDINGKIIIKGYDSIEILTKNLLEVEKNNEKFIIDFKENIILNKVNKCVISNNEDTVIVSLKDKGYCLLNNGKIASEFYDDILCSGDGNYIAKDKGLDEVKLIDKNGNTLIDWTFEIYESNESGYRVVVKNNKKYSLFDKDFNLILDDYDFLGNFENEGLILTIDENKEFIYININGEKIAGPYKKAESFKNGFALTSNDGAVIKVINTKGQQVFTECKSFYSYRRDDKYSSIMLLNDDIVMMTPEGKYLIDKENFPIDKKDEFLRQYPEYIDEFKK